MPMTTTITLNEPSIFSSIKYVHRVFLVLVVIMLLVSGSVHAQQSAKQCEFNQLRLCTPTSVTSDFRGAGDYEKGDPGCGSVKEIVLTYYALAMHSGTAVLDMAGVYNKEMISVAKLRDYRFVHRGDRYLSTLKPTAPNGDVELMVIRKNEPQLMELWAGKCIVREVNEEAFAKKMDAMARQ